MICQVIYATIKGDVTICAAYSHELPKYGMKAGLTNYAATYATGLLCARRLLTKYDLAETYEGNTENLGEDYNVEAEGDRRPFKCYLDTGLVRTSTGSRVVFAALKGAVDGGLDIPHNDKRYAGYDLQDKSLDTDSRALHQGWCRRRVRRGDGGGGACLAPTRRPWIPPALFPSSLGFRRRDLESRR